MPWFRNYYRCARCGHEWSDDWTATCDDDCPQCGARHMSPYKSDDIDPPGSGRPVRPATQRQAIDLKSPSPSSRTLAITSRKRAARRPEESAVGPQERRRGRAPHGASSLRGRRAMSTDKIRELNDAFRTTFTGGRVMLTASVDALPSDVKAMAIRKVATFDDFDRRQRPAPRARFRRLRPRRPQVLLENRRVRCRLPVRLGRPGRSGQNHSRPHASCSPRTTDFPAPSERRGVFCRDCIGQR